MKRSRNSRDARLEIYIAATWPGGFKTRSSGSLHREGDVRSDDFMIECKFRNTANFTLTPDFQDKLNHECTPRGLTPIWVFENSHGDRIAMLNYADLVRIIGQMELAIPSKTKKKEENGS